MSLTSLPSELLDHICSYISFDDAKYLAQVCSSLNHFVVMNIFRRHIQYLASQDAKLEMTLRQMNWSFDCVDFDLIDKIFTKLDSTERWLKDSSFSEQVILEFPSSMGHKMKVSACALYKDKFFVSFDGGNVQSRSCLDFSLINVLHDAPLHHDTSETAFLTTPMALTQKDSKGLLAVSVASAATVYLWNADSDEQLAAYQVPSEVNRIYELKLNSTHIVCLASWSLIAWNHQNNSTEPEVMKDIPEVSQQQGKTNMFFEVHSMDMNEEFVVTHACQPLINAFLHNGPSTYTYITCRRLLNGQSSLLGPNLKPNASEVDHLEVNKIRLSSSKYNLLAIMTSREVLTFSFTIKIMKIPSGEFIENVMEDLSFRSEIRGPINWVDKRLFVKYAPKIRNLEQQNNPQDVILHVWNCDTDEELSLEHVGMSSLQDDVVVDHTRVVQVMNYRYKPIDRDELVHQIVAKVHNFWDN